MSTQTAALLSDQDHAPWDEQVLIRELERETGLEPATFCLGSVELVSAVARAWRGERMRLS